MTRGKKNAPSLVILACFAGLLAACAAAPPAQQAPPTATTLTLAEHCAQMIGPPRVERISEHVWAAIGYDTASVVLIATPKGHVIVDSGMSPARAHVMRAALEAAVPPGPVLALIYTHSHIDHVGGASVWVEPDTPILATGQLAEHLLKQYQMFLPAEAVRGRRQFGLRVAEDDLPCSALGPRPDMAAARASGILMPTRTFQGRARLELGGLAIELIESPGETHDQLVVWVPDDRTLLCADNFYWAFPNLYTIRGTSPRPVSGWIKSLDMMRGLKPLHLIGQHTKALHGQPEISDALTNYRDAIQWVRDQVVRGANQGLDLDTLAQSIKLPPHLAGLPYLQERYGQVDWSVRAIYANELGWFDGSPDKLYPLPAPEAATREIALMGGADKVAELARQALEDGQARWAVHLLAKLKTSGLAQGRTDLNPLLARAYAAVAREVDNTNGRAYLLESAIELTQGPAPMGKMEVPPQMIQSIPLANMLEVMATRLRPDQAGDAAESLVLHFPDVNTRYNLTLRRGVCEVIEGQPLPGTPEPVATITLAADDFRRLALKLDSALALQARGRLKIEGSWLGARSFLARFGD
jgi:alkyl sulfatase BDS1-like metallo-beta-lactamase superfamily hydrolase